MSAVRPIIRPILRQAIRSVFQGGAFDPVSLFASGEQGAWYDPTLPERELGAELADVADQTISSGSGSISDGGFNITASGAFAGIVQANAIEAGKVYKVSIEWSGNDEGRRITINLGSGQSVVDVGARAISGTASVILPAGVSDIKAYFGDSVSGDTFYLKLTSARAITNYSQWLSDTTLYQDSAGTTPVQTDGDPVGLMLDKSQGLVLGAEIDNNANIPFRVFRTSTEIVSYTPGYNLEAGKTYSINYTVSDNPGTVSAAFRVNGSSVNLEPSITIEPSFTGTRTVKTTPTVTGSFQVVGDGDGADLTLSSFSVKELPGNHATQDTTALKPLYRTDGTLSWLEFDGVDDYLAFPATAFKTMALSIDINGPSNFGPMGILSDQPIGTNSGSNIFIRADNIYSVSMDGASVNTGGAAINGGELTPADLLGTNIAASGFTAYPNDTSVLYMEHPAETPYQVLGAQTSAVTTFYMAGRLFGFLAFNQSGTTKKSAIEKYVADIAGGTL